MIRAQLFHEESPPRSVDVADWPTLCQDDANLLWVDVEAAENGEVDRVARMFNLEPGAVDIAQRVNRRPTVRVYGNHYVVTVLGIDVHESESAPRITVIEIDLFVGRNFLMSLHKRPLPFAKELQERTESNPRLGRFDSAYLLYVFLDTLNGHLARELEEVEARVEKLEERLMREPGAAVLQDAMLTKRHLNTLRRLVAPHREAFGTLAAVDSPVPEPTVEGYFRELVAHFSAHIEHLDHLRNTLTASYSLYLTNLGQQTNQQLKVLTFLSAVLLPMTVVTGLFGTNFRLAEYEQWEPFYLMLVGMGLITLAMLAIFRARKWL